MNENDYHSWQDYPLVRYVWACIILDGAGERFLNPDTVFAPPTFEVPSDAQCTVRILSGRNLESATFCIEGPFTEEDLAWALNLVRRGAATVVASWGNTTPAYFEVCPFDEYSPI